MRRIAFPFLILISMKAFGQFDSSFHFYYYDQKLGMFERMPDQKDEVVWLGDSITDNCEWSELFPHLKTLNRGISSDITYGVLHRLPEIIRRQPKTIFVMIGINDIARPIPDSVILANHLKIIRRIKAGSPRTRIILQSILPTNNEFSDFPRYQNKLDHIKLVNAGLKKIAAQEKITYIDLYSKFTDAAGKLDKRYTNDGVHLTGEGYANWKRLIQPYTGS